ncbi:MAG: hypothetical protein RBS38_02770 [Bacteroidales bacterium]|jgi:hypothetical protein|nr:hypothetical protein [Bacteroidales bacterium]
MKKAQGTRVHRSFSEGGGRRAQGEGQGILFLLVVLCAGVIFSSGCSKDDFPVTEDNDAVGEIQMNTLFNIIEISDGFIVSGVSDSKIKISKLDANFNTLWSKNDFEWGEIFSEGGWGGAFYSVDIVNAVEKGNGNIILFCSIMEGTDVMLHSALIVRLDRSGKELYRKEMDQYMLINASATDDDKYLLFGSSLIRLNSDFSTAWENDDHNYVFSGANAIQTGDNGFAVTGTLNSQQVLLQKLDENGIIQWTKSNFNPYPFNDLGYDLHQLSDNGFIITGRTRNINEPWDMNCFIIRTESSGDTLWTRKYGEGSDEWFEEILYASDDEFVIRRTVGFPNDTERKAFLMSITGDGEISESGEININDNFLWTSSGYFVRAQKEGDRIISLSKVQLENLFD